MRPPRSKTTRLTFLPLAAVPSDSWEPTQVARSVIVPFDVLVADGVEGLHGQRAAGGVVDATCALMLRQGNLDRQPAGAPVCL